MKLEKVKAAMPDPRQPYGEAVSIDSINIRERHALEDERNRYFIETQRLMTEHHDRVREIKAEFNRQRENHIRLALQRRAA